MTFEGARTEAIRRTKALGTVHYVVDSGVRDGYMVLTHVPPKYTHAVIATYEPNNLPVE